MRFCVALGKHAAACFHCCFLSHHTASDSCNAAIQCLHAEIASVVWEMTHLESDHVSFAKRACAKAPYRPCAKQIMEKMIAPYSTGAPVGG